eukprot:SAG31_NODE_3602_length_4080_cov_6.988194_6_plen_86_part_00
MESVTEDWLSPPRGDDASATWPEDGYLKHVPWVDVRFTFLQIKKIDTVNGVAFIKLRVYAYWTDPRLIGWKDAKLPGSLWAIGRL